MGGRIGLESSPGSGSTFWFEIELPVSGSDDKPSSDERLRGLHLVVADHNEAACRVLEDRLVSWGCRVTARTGGNDLLELISAGDIDVLLMDAQLPDIDYVEFLTQLEQMGTRTQVVLMAPTGAAKFVMPKDLRSKIAVVNKPARRAHIHRAILHRRNEPFSVHGSQSGIPSGKPLEGLRILLAEDNPVNQKVATNLLMKLGAKVELAGNGSEVMTLVETSPFDLILMDCHMPEMDGYEATQAIRAKESGTERHIPIVAMTANAMQGDRETCLAAGMDEYTTKPVRAGELVAAIKRSLPLSHAA
jgi:CheY-like chemotaxis protein